MTRKLACAAMLAAVAMLSARSAGAQQDTAIKAVPPPAGADTDSTPPRALPLNGLLLRPQQLRYAMDIVSPDSTRLVGYRDVGLQQSTYGAFPAWLIAESRGGSVPSEDTLYLSAAELRPLHWSSVIGPSRMALEFTGDSIYGATSGPPGNQTIALARPGDLLAGAAMTELALQIMPHRVGRVDSVSVLMIDLGSNQIVPGVLSVDGEQDVATAMGQMHCWVMSLTTVLGTAHYWVAESNPVVVQTRQDLPGHPGSVFEQRLVARQ